MRRDGGQALVDEPDRHRGHQLGQPDGIERAIVGLALLAREVSWQPDDDLDGSDLRGESDDLVQVGVGRGVTAPGCALGARGPRGIRGGDADAGVAHVDADPRSRAWVRWDVRRPGSCAPGAKLVLDRAERVRDLRRVAPTALGDVVLAAATAAQDLSRDADVGAGLDALATRRSLVATMTNGRPPPPPPHGHDDRSVAAEARCGRRARGRAGPRPDVRARVVADEGDAAEVTRARDETGCGTEHLALLDRGDLPLGVLELGEQARDAVQEARRAAR